MSLLMCDVDYFKPYNDIYGHQQGDISLQQVTRALARDIKRPADLVASFGGEEFVIVLPETSTHGALAVAEKIRAGVASHKISHASSPVEKRLTVRIGAAVRALYQAKASGRNRFQILQSSA